MDKFFALTISDRELKFASLSKKGESFKIEKLERRDLPGSLVSDFEIVDQKTFVSTLREFFFNSHPKIEVGPLILALPPQKTFLKTIKLPKDTQNLKEVILHKAVSNFPLTEETGYFDWRKIGEEIQVAAAPKRLIDNWVFTFKSAALSVLGVKPFSLAFLNLVEGDDLCLVVYSDEELAQIVIGKKGLIYEVETVKIDENFEKSSEYLAKKINDAKEDFEKANPDLKIEKLLLHTPNNKKLSSGVKDENLVIEDLKLPFETGKEEEEFFAPIALAIFESSDLLQEINFPPQEKALEEKNQSRKESRNFSIFKFLKVPLFLLLILVVGFMLYKFFGASLLSNRLSQKPSATPTPQIEKEVSTSSAQNIATKSAGATPSAELKKQAKIKILNGNGVSGDAAKAKSYLSDKGWNVASTANAEKQDYEKTEVHIKKSFEGLKNDLTSDLEGKYKVVVGDNLEDSDTADVEVIIGIT